MERMATGASSSAGASMNGAKKPAAMGGPPKKMVIKPLKKKPKLPENFEEQTWAKLQGAVQAVHSKKPVGSSLEELYRAVEDMCIHKMAENVYNKLQLECEQHIQQKLDSLLGQTPDSLAFLTLVHGTWNDHCEQMLTIRSIFLYLDRTFVIQTSHARSLWDMGLQLFRHHLSNRPELSKKTVVGLLALIEKERSGDQVDRTLIHNLLRMFTALQIYTDSFESEFLTATTGFYTAEGERYMANSDVSEYLTHVEGRLNEENQRVTHYLHSSSRKHLLTVVHNTLLATRVMAIIDKGFDGLMDTSRHDDLARMYQLFSHVNAHSQMKQAFSGYIKKRGTEMVTDPERDKQLVQDLLDFKERVDHIHQAALDKNPEFFYALKEAFESFINVRQNRPAELVAKFIDSKLRAGNKGSTEEELEAVLDKAMILFRFIEGKDMFEAFYKKDLAKRLLLGKSASFDAEKSMISKLKAECGCTFTAKLEGMFKDVDLSKDIMTSFKQSEMARNRLAAANLSDCELNVHVLTTGYWPTYTPLELKLPKEVAELQEVFTNFYLSKHTGRRLQWHNSLGHCVLKANFPLGKRELSVSLLQTVILMLFNDADGIGFMEIKEATGIEDKELRVTLQSLACAKVRVLSKKPKGRDVEDGDEFYFNTEFTQKLFRIKVNSIQMKETVQENEQTTERVFQDRQYQIDAAIVRIMKARKTLSHTLLISELYQQLKFPLKPQDLKKRIESLIDREYLERDSKNSQMYKYLA